MGYNEDKEKKSIYKREEEEYTNYGKIAKTKIDRLASGGFQFRCSNSNT
jgi:hypothetical protein